MRHGPAPAESALPHYHSAHGLEQAECNYIEAETKVDTCLEAKARQASHNRRHITRIGKNLSN